MQDKGEKDGGAVHEIVLIRRRSEVDHDEPHGGVWKVAFADFMTAMMAFFLVLWIVNSTTKETRSSLARYFNPVRLSDTTPARRGLKDPKDEDFDAGSDSKGTAKESSSKSKEPVTATVSTRDASTAAPMTGAVATSAGAAAATAAGYDDPFVRMTIASQSPSQANESPVQRPRRDDAVADGNDRQPAAVKTLVAELARSLGEEFARLGAALEVTASGDDLLISLTDVSEFGMFAVGSASPEARLVHVVEAVSRALQKRRGELVVRGHTDARPFRGIGSDNWQLSSARAQTAARLLVSGGLDERRIERIEGYADHRLRRPDAPGAPENRRIEILLRAAAQ